jgi:ribosome-associated protein
MGALTAEATARLAARAAIDKNAEKLVVLDLQGLSTVADFFIVCTARSTTQADTIVEAVRAALKAAGTRPRHQEGSAESGWLLLDYIDVIVHVFLEETRGFYALERLWGDAPLLSVDGGAGTRD